MAAVEDLKDAESRAREASHVLEMVQTLHQVAIAFGVTGQPPERVILAFVNALRFLTRGMSPENQFKIGEIVTHGSRAAFLTPEQRAESRAMADLMIEKLAAERS